MRINTAVAAVGLSLSMIACTNSDSADSASDQAAVMHEPISANLWPKYTPSATTFSLWNPEAEAVEVRLYETGEGGEPTETIPMTAQKDGIWGTTVIGDLNRTFYTYRVKMKGQWLDETPGIYATAVGVNGQRAMVLDMKATNPDTWANDNGPLLGAPNEAVIYELHVRDITIHPNAGSSAPGTFLGLVERGTVGPEGVTTAIDHMKELGITHVHLLPAFDHYAIDETRLDEPQYNWGYDPNNYNVPEGSYSSDPYNPAARIREFKKMVRTFHANGIGVILDVVYNHTGVTEGSNFNREYPGYYYRHKADGSWSDASACGNETASEKAMMRKFMVESVLHWAKEYHIDGFRFDLMGIHDLETMNQIAAEVKNHNPSAFVYGEGWTAGDSPLPEADRALKKHTNQLEFVSAFSDDIRDGLKGSVFEDESTGFVSGAAGMEQSVRFGVVGSIEHPEIDYAAVNYSDAPWSNEPWQSVSYVSCHDNHTLYDKLKISRPDATEAEIAAMHRLANAVVLTSQGIPFLHAGSEMMRTKGGEHNSYNKPDAINRIDWNWKVQNKETYNYYRALIALRKSHPALFMPTAEQVRQNLTFADTDPGVVAFIISNNANGDEWSQIMVIYNANTQAASIPLDDEWQVAVSDLEVNEFGIEAVSETAHVPAISMVLLFRK